MATIRELVDSGAIRVGAHDFSAAYDLSVEEIRQIQADEYAGAVVLAPNDPLPPEVGERRWANRLYIKEDPGQQDYDAATRSIVHSPPPLWLVVWTTEEIEAAHRAANPILREVSFKEFQALRHGAPVVEG